MTASFPNLCTLSALPLRWQAPWMLPAAVAVGAALAAAVVWLYPRQVALVRRPWRWVLPGLRAAALLALAASLARPVALRTLPAEDERGAVLVMIDRSASMGVADAGRKPAALVALADGMGLLPQGARARPAAQIQDDLDELERTAGQTFRAHAELNYARVSGRGIEAAEALFRESSVRLTTLGKKIAARAAAMADPKEAPAGLSRKGPRAAAEQRALAQVRNRLKPLAKLPQPQSGGRADWIPQTRRSVEEAKKAMNAYQDDADARLYAFDADVRRVCQVLDRQSRLSLVEDALLRPETGVVGRIAGRAPVLGYAFASADGLIALGPLRPPGDAGGEDDFGEGEPLGLAGAGSLGVVADGRATDLTGSVVAALRSMEGRAVRAVVVLSDGRQVGPEAASLASLAAAGVPVIAVNAAPPGAPRDVSLVQVSAPRTAFVGETVTVTAQIQESGMTADAARVRFQLGDGDERAPDRVTDPREHRDPRGKPASGAGAERPTRKGVEFRVKMEQAGEQLLTVSLPVSGDEATAENNRVQRWVKVLPEKIRVGAYAGTPGWDFQYLRSALSRRPWFDLDAGVLDERSPRLPLTPRQILALDVLVLADVPVHALDTGQWDAVYTLVEKRGGSVVLLAGDALAVADYAEQPFARALLPWPAQARPAWRVWPGNQPNYRVVPAGPLENDLAFLKWDEADAEASVRRWQELPGLYRIVDVPGRLKQNTDVLLHEAASGRPVLTVNRPGAGRVFFLATHETWRWRYQVGEGEQDWFWRQLVREAAGDPYAVRDGAFALDVEEAAVAPGQPVRVRARVPSAAPGDARAATPAASAAYNLEITRDGKPERSQPLREEIPGSGRLEATLTGLTDGHYQIRLVGPGAGDMLRALLHVRPSWEQELRNVGSDVAALAKLTEATGGGQVLQLDRIGQLPARLAAVTETTPEVAEWSLWDSPYLFVFVLACLGAEWGLRKRFGLA